MFFLVLSSEKRKKRLTRAPCAMNVCYYSEKKKKRVERISTHIRACARFNNKRTEEEGKKRKERQKKKDERRGKKDGRCYQCQSLDKNVWRTSSVGFSFCRARASDNMGSREEEKKNFGDVPIDCVLITNEDHARKRSQRSH